MGQAGLVLTGGGARAAYQVGAIHALSEIAGTRRLPFDTVSGVSAGAVNAAALAAGADDFQRAARRLTQIWGLLSPDRVYRTDFPHLAGIGTRWIRDLTMGGLWAKHRINYLLDTAPMRRLLGRTIRLQRVPGHFRSGALRGFAISATNYLTGTGITFFDGDAAIEPWARSQRLGIRESITLDHVMASSAIPIFFPPVRIGEVFFGDGCVRMLAPLSPAIHMGSDRILAIGVHHRRQPEETADRQKRVHGDTLPLSEIAGVLLNAVFLDSSVEGDAERLERINRTVRFVPPRARRGVALRIIPTLILRPSRDLGELAANADVRLPWMVRYLLRGIGATGAVGNDLISYLAFEHVYLRRLMDVGYEDTLARREEIQYFLGAALDDLEALVPPPEQTLAEQPTARE